jgi:hypothetical protein
MYYVIRSDMTMLRLCSYNNGHSYEDDYLSTKFRSMATEFGSRELANSAADMVRLRWPQHSFAVVYFRNGIQ